MRNWKQSTFFGILAVLAVALTQVACDDGSTHTHDAGTWHTTLAATCSVTGTKELRCNSCNETLDTGIIDKIDHTWDWVVTNSATTETAGIETEKCTICGEESGNTRPIAQLSCDCPNGSLHLVGEDCCSGLGCNCKKNVVGQRANVPEKATNGIPITNREGISAEDFATMVTAVETALNHTQLASATRQEYIKDNISEIKIIQGDGAADPVISVKVLSQTKEFL
jgi:hypothetical protein